MALRNIVEKDGAGSDILRKHCRSVGSVDDRIRTILDDMVDTMREANGVGLAAPQIGIMRRMFVAEPEPGEVYYFVDPEITEREGQQESEEGCLSVPGFAGSVKRPAKIKIKGLGRDGEEQEFEFDEFRAVVMCHEYDHLDGILYVDKAEEVHPISAEGDGE